MITVTASGKRHALDRTVAQTRLQYSDSRLNCALSSNLLESKADGIEVSYNACGVLSHIMFDGPEVWTVENPNREMVMDKMWDAIQSWDVTSRRNINYRCGFNS